MNTRQSKPSRQPCTKLADCQIRSQLLQIICQYDRLINILPSLDDSLVGSRALAFERGSSVVTIERQTKTSTLIDPSKSDGEMTRAEGAYYISVYRTQFSWTRN